MIKLNISKSGVSKKSFLKIENKIKNIHDKIYKRTGEKSEMLDWVKWPKNYYESEVDGMIKKADELINDLKIEKLLVIGIGGSYLGAKSAIDFINGGVRTNKKVLFVGTNMSPSHYIQVEEELEGSKWAISVISKSGTTLEPALAFRHFKKILSDKVGKNNISKYITAITDKEKGALKILANQEKYTTFTIPDGIGGRFSGITPVGLFPMAFAGIDIREVLAGARDMMETLEEQNGLDNIAYQYASTRFLLNKRRKGLNVEVLTTYDPDLKFTSEWWKQLFGESEGKNGKGIFPTSVDYSADLHSLGQYIQDGQKIMFETTLWVEESDVSIKVKSDSKNIDNLNYLTGNDLHKINKKAMMAVVDAHVQGGNPQIIIEISDKSARTLGELWYFFFMGVSMSGYLLEINPFDQPGVELYKKMMFKNLGKPN